MNFVIRSLLVIFFATSSQALDNMEQENTPITNDQASNQAFDFNDTIAQEIDNYSNNLASEILNDEHDSNNNIISKNAPISKQSVKLDLKYSVLTIVNKITAKSENFILERNKIYKYKNISLEALHCQKSENNDFEDRVLLKISEYNPKEDQIKELFSGWLLAKSSLTSLTHPIYDITLTECTTTAQ